MKSVSNLQLQHGRALELNSTDNSKTGSIRQDGGAVKITGASNGVAISAGHNLIFQGSTANIGGLGSILTVGNNGDTIAMNATGATYMLPNITGNTKIAGTLDATSLTVGGTTIVGSDKKLDWGLLKNIPTSFTPATHDHDDRYFTETELGATTGTTGATRIGMSAITGVTGTNVQTALSSLKGLIDGKEASFTKNTAFNKNFGTAAGTVAEGNHVHTWSQISGKPAEFIPAPHDHDGVYQSNIIDVVCDTAAATAAKVITIPNYTLQNGDMFAIKFTLGSSVSTPTLNINGVGAKNIRLGSTNASTTTMTVGANGVVLLYFDGDYFQLLGSHRTSDAVDDTSMYHSVKKTMGAALYSYKMMAEGVDGKYYPFTLETGTGTSKTVSTAEYKLGGTILYYSTTTTVAAGATVSSTYSSINHTRMNYTFNQSGGYELYKPIYLVGYLQGSDRFVLDNSSPTSFYTQTLPTTDDGKIYISLGQVYDTNSMRLQLTHTIYEFKDGELRQYVPSHAHNPSEVGLGNVDNEQQATKVEFIAHDTDSVRHITQTERNLWNGKTSLALGTTSSTAYRGDQGLIAYNHSQASHAPSDAQKNSDITKAEIEAKLTGGITTHTHTFASLTSRPTTISGFGITDAYTKLEVDNKVAAVVGSAPATLDTLNELATALGNDANFATTISNQIGLKANSADVYTKTNLQTSGQASIHFNNLTNLPTSYTPSVHDHDDRYFTETESDSRFVRTGTRTDNYLWMRRNSSDAASFFTQQGTGDIVRFYKGTGDGTLMSSIDNSGNFTGNSATATKWLASRTITLAGDLSGTISIDGSSNVSASISALRIKSTDNRTIKPNATSKASMDAFFTSSSNLLAGMSGYSDLLVLNGYGDVSGGKVNALEFDKSLMALRHYQVDQGATSWGTPKTLAYTTDITWANLSGAPTTLAGYGITDAATSSHNHTIASLTDTTVSSPTSGQVLSWNGSKWINFTLTAASLPDASTSAKGIVQLSSATNSTSTTLAATASAVKAAYDLANGKAASSHTHNFTDLTDVTITAPASNHAFHYDGTKWVNTATPCAKAWLTEGYQTATATAANQWTKIASINLTATGQVATARMDLTGGNDTGASGTSPLASIFFRVRQQAAMGSAPIVGIRLMENQNITINEFKAVTATNTASSTVVDLYVKIVDSGEKFFFAPILHNGSVTFLENQALVTTLPAGTQTAAVYYMIDIPQLPSATTSAKGIVQLSSATNSTSTALAATASAVKAAYDLANHGHPYLSDSATSQQVISGSEVNVRSTTTSNAFKIEFNETEQSLDFVFS